MILIYSKNTVVLKNYSCGFFVFFALQNSPMPQVSVNFIMSQFQSLSTALISLALIS